MYHWSSGSLHCAVFVELQEAVRAPSLTPLTKPNEAHGGNKAHSTRVTPAGCLLGTGEHQTALQQLRSCHVSYLQLPAAAAVSSPHTPSRSCQHSLRLEAQGTRPHRNAHSHTRGTMPPSSANPQHLNHQPLPCSVAECGMFPLDLAQLCSCACHCRPLPCSMSEVTQLLVHKGHHRHILQRHPGMYVKPLGLT